MKTKTRVRFAPSPTGYLHIGGLRTALYDYLFAQKNGGDFVLKIEDTDRKRFVEGAVENLISSLDFLGLERNEGVFQQASIKNDNIQAIESKSYPGVLEVGEFGPYIQSEKLEVYKKYAEQLVADGHAYYCFCEPERLEEMRSEQTALKRPPIYDQYCLNNITPAEINAKLKENCSYTIRLKIPKDETIEFEDAVRGKVKFETNLVDDQVLLKSDGFPTYHLANVIDDHDMQITHVIRGEEWLSSVPKHILLYRFFGWAPPTFAHLPLLLNADKSKLSKRQGDVAVEDYIKKGYLKEAIINFVAFLGWNPGNGETQEIFTLSELVDRFDFAHVHKGGAVFDIKKLDWINAQWIKKIPISDLYQRSLEFLQTKDFYVNAPEEKKSEIYLKKILGIERGRLLRLSAVGEDSHFLFKKEIHYDGELLRWKECEDAETRKSLELSKNVLDKMDDNFFEFDPDSQMENDGLKRIMETFMRVAEDNFTDDAGKVDRGKLLWPLRVALTGEQRSSSPFEVAQILGKVESISRIEMAIKKIN